MTPPVVKTGDRVKVQDGALGLLRQIMRDAGENPRPNHHGTVHGIDEDGWVEIWFDEPERGKGMGQAATYHISEVEHLPESEEWLS